MPLFLSLHLYSISTPKSGTRRYWNIPKRSRIIHKSEGDLALALKWGFDWRWYTHITPGTDETALVPAFHGTWEMAHGFPVVNYMEGLGDRGSWIGPISWSSNSLFSFRFLYFFLSFIPSCFPIPHTLSLILLLFFFSSLPSFHLSFFYSPIPVHLYWFGSSSFLLSLILIFFYLDF